MPIFNGKPESSGRQQATYISDAERDSLLSRLVSGPLSVASDIGWGLDTPAAALRSVIYGAQTGEWRNPLSEETRVYGRDLTKAAGLRAGEGVMNGWVDFGTDFAVEALLDPLAWVTGPTKSLTASGRLLERAGLIPDAARAASQRLSQQVAAGAPVPRFAANTVKQMGPVEDVARAVTNYGEHYGRPLVGKRDSLRNQTLREFLDSDPTQKYERSRRIADVMGLPPDPSATLYSIPKIPDELLDDKLGKQFGFALPFANDNFAAFDVPGGALAGDALDRVGDYVRWGAPGRAFNSLTSGALAGTYDPLSQAIAAKTAAYGDQGEAALGRQFISEIGYGAEFSDTDLFTEAMGESLARKMEQPSGTGPYVPQIATTADDDLYNNVPAYKNAVDKWNSIRKSLLAESERLGAGSAELKHPYGLGYVPYTENIKGFSEGGRRKVFDPVTGDMLHRAEYNKMPGGLEQLQDIASNPALSGKNRTLQMPENLVALDPKMVPASDEFVAARIKEMVNSKVPVQIPLKHGLPEYSSEDALGLARMLHGLEEAKPIFGTHPLESIAQYMQGRGRKHGMIDALLDSVVGQAVPGTYASRAGGGHISIKDALGNRLGLKEGAVTEFERRIGLKSGAKNVSADDFSVPEEVIDRISRMADSYSSPALQSSALQYMKSFNNLWKATNLLSPARHVRDNYSSAINNVLLAGGRAATYGMPAAAALMNGRADKWQKFAPFLEEIPRYKAISKPEDRLKAFLLDAGESRVLQGMGNLGSDLGDRTGEAIKNLIPGSKAEELFTTPTKLSDWWTFRGVNSRQTLNPVYRAGEVLGDRADEFHRLTGYLALLRDGYDPVEAGRLVRRQHVDYGSLSATEKAVRDYGLPFYTYESRSLARTLGDIASRPGGRTAQMLRGINRASDPSEEDAPYLSDEIRRQPPYISLGNNRYLTNIDFPGIPALGAMSVVRAADGRIDPTETIRNTLLNYASKSAPAPKALAEWLYDTDTYNKRPLRDRVTNADLLGRAITGDSEWKLPVLANVLINALPSIPLGGSTLVSQLANPKNGEEFVDRIGPAMLAWSTGARIKESTAESARADAQRRVSGVLKPYTKKIGVVSIPDEFLPSLSPYERDAYELHRRLERDRNAAVRNR